MRKKTQHLARIKLAFLLLGATSASAGINQFSGSHLMVKPHWAQPRFELKFKSLAAPETVPVEWGPNTRAVSGVDIYLKDFIGIGFATKAPIEDRDRLLKGETKYQDIRISLSRPRIFLQLNYQQYQGFYVENSTTIDRYLTSTDPRIQAPDMKLLNLSGNLIYTAAPEKFSMRAFLDHTVRQENSGGSFLVGLSIAETTFRNGTESFIPYQVRASYGINRDIYEGQFLSGSMSGGYGYSLIFARKFYISLAGLLGYGYQQYWIKDEGRTVNKTGGAAKADLYAGLGFNGDRLIVAMTFLADMTQYPTESMVISTTLYSAITSVGLRF